MERLSRFVEGLCTAGAFFSALFMIGIVILIMIEVVMRSLFNTSTMITSEFSGYFLVALVVLGLGHTLHHEGHIRITLLRGRLGPVGRKRLDLVVGSLGLCLCLFALYFTVLMVLDTRSLGMRADTVAETPLWMPQAVIPVGLGLFALQLFAFLVRRARS
ncbi:TRAP transporter small permease subunit [Desulfohalobium retbaense]|uniref:Tripartite ATP-independent periplasmic transporter DctQ component n=1 Tax=Desulfohalobium retbaense (strain ATCC 49708 / DSM 5692 / JCM 16813 / HR100) TaxID=485915 RepID=C8WYT9_DESRD|nr:TRAP transporter small permease [Desulfohalobium retbaense]ACV67855.1 Tripartite ATP-independent periplasmic transporter DctQ component [Desulfohalobium retbaense DSM 5692]